MDGQIVKRLADDSGSSSDEDKRPAKLLKTAPTKATDILAGPSTFQQPLRKKINYLVKPKSTPPPPPTVTKPAASLGGLSLLGSYSDSSSDDN